MPVLTDAALREIRELKDGMDEHNPKHANQLRHWVDQLIAVCEAQKQEITRLTPYKERLENVVKELVELQDTYTKHNAELQATADTLRADRAETEKNTK